MTRKKKKRTIWTTSDESQSLRGPSHPQVGEGGPSLLALKNLFMEYLYFDKGQESVINFVAAVTIANRWKDQTSPLWAYIVGPSGVGKTTILEAFGDHDEFYLIDSLGPNSFISGYRDKDDKKDKSLLPLIGGRTLLILDFSTILALHPDARQQIFSDLRRLYDGGELKKHKGNLGLVEHKARFGLIAAVTRDIERLSAQTAPLGERFLTYAVDLKHRKAFQKKAALWSQEKYDIKQYLVDHVGDFLAKIPWEPPKSIKMPKAMAISINSLADLVTVWRTWVPRTQRSEGGGPLYIPQPEAPGRFGNQLYLLAKGSALANERSVVVTEDLELVARVAWDCLPSWRRAILKSFSTRQTARCFEIAQQLGVDRSSVKRHLEDLCLLKALKMYGRGEYLMEQHTRKGFKEVLPIWQKIIR